MTKTIKRIKISWIKFGDIKYIIYAKKGLKAMEENKEVILTQEGFENLEKVFYNAIQ